jgi:hypothetical protein
LSLIKACSSRKVAALLAQKNGKNKGQRTFFEKSCPGFAFCLRLKAVAGGPSLATLRFIYCPSPMNSRHGFSMSKHRPRGFEALEARDALDGTALTLTQLPLAAPSFARVSVYAAPIGPAPAPAVAALMPGTAMATTLQPISAEYLQRLGVGALPIGPARPATLPSQQPAVASRPVSSAPPLYADGTLPNNQAPANLPTTRATMPVDSIPSDVPTLVLSRPRF